MSNEELVKSIQSGNKEAMIQLWSQVERLATLLTKKWSGVVEREDLMQEAFIALDLAARDYEQRNNTTFAGYYAKRLQWHFAEYAARSNGAYIPANLFWKVLKYRRYLNDYKKQTGVDPDQWTIMQALNLQKNELQTLKDLSKRLQVRSLDESIGHSEDGDELLIGDTVADPENQYEEILDDVEADQISEALWEVVDTLPEAERECIISRFKDGLTMKETAERLGVTLSTVRGRDASAMQKLRSGQNRRKLQLAMLDSERYSYGLRRMQRFDGMLWSSTEFAVMHLLDKYDS